MTEPADAERAAQARQHLGNQRRAEALEQLFRGEIEGRTVDFEKERRFKSHHRSRPLRIARVQIGHFPHHLARTETAQRPALDGDFHEALDDDTKESVAVALPDQPHHDLPAAHPE